MDISRIFKWSTGLRRRAKLKRYRRNRKHSFYTMSNGMLIQRHIVITDEDMAVIIGKEQDEGLFEEEEE